MTIDKAFFVSILKLAEPEIIGHLDRLSCGCNYVSHWCFKMDMGRWNPQLDEMDFELKDIKNSEQLYDFLILHIHDIQK